jgi:hypothetical protein
MSSIVVYRIMHLNHFLGYEHGHPLEKLFSYEAPTTSAIFRLPDIAFHTFNSPPELVLLVYRPVAESYRAADMRSLSVGDVLRVGETWLAGAETSWIALADEPSEVSGD